MGDSMDLLQQAIALIEQQAGVVTAKSPVYTTAAWGLENQPDFLNMALCVDTDLSAIDLLKTVRHIEAALGRERKIKWGQRTMDIDILLYNDNIINLPELVLPHPSMHLRRFVLVPLNEIAATVLHPVYKKTISRLLEECEDKLEVTLYRQATDY